MEEKKNIKGGAGCLGATLIGVVIFVVLLIIGILMYSYYNGMVTREEAVNTSWAQVENVYQRRADLIKNIVAAVKGYATHEQTTLTNVIEARAKATQITVKPEKLDESAIQKFEEAQNNLSSALARLMVVVEQYPNLKADASFMRLINQLEETENGITIERKRFNEVAQEYNVYIRKFPRNIFAKLFGFEKKGYFKSQEGAQTAPDVKF